MKGTLRVEDEKHSIIYSICLILPPVLIMGLSIIPPDFGSAILWIAGGLYAVKSTLKLMYLLFFNLDQHGVQARHWKEKAKIFSEAAVLIVFILSIYSVKISWEAAKEFTLQTADQVQEECNRSVCPEEIEGWNSKVRGTSFLRVGKCAKYGLRYTLEGPEQYRLTLRQDIDRDVVVRGGKGREISVKKYPLPSP